MFEISPTNCCSVGRSIIASRLSQFCFFLLLLLTAQAGVNLQSMAAEVFHVNIQKATHESSNRWNCRIAGSTAKYCRKVAQFHQDRHHYSCFILSARHLGHSHYLTDFSNVTQRLPRGVDACEKCLSSYSKACIRFHHCLILRITVCAMHVPSRAGPSNKKSAVILNGHALLFCEYSVMCPIRYALSSMTEVNQTAYRRLCPLQSRDFL